MKNPATGWPCRMVKPFLLGVIQRLGFVCVYMSVCVEEHVHVCACACTCVCACARCRGRVSKLAHFRQAAENVPFLSNGCQGVKSKRHSPSANKQTNKRAGWSPPLPPCLISFGCPPPSRQKKWAGSVGEEGIRTAVFIPQTSVGVWERRCGRASSDETEGDDYREHQQSPVPASVPHTRTRSHTHIHKHITASQTRHACCGASTATERAGSGVQSEREYEEAGLEFKRLTELIKFVCASPPPHGQTEQHQGLPQQADASEPHSHATDVSRWLCRWFTVTPL